MSLSDLAALGSFVSGFAVLVSLVFLYFQIRQVNAQVKQAEKNQKAAIRHSRINRLVELNTGCMDASIADAISKGLSGAEDISLTQLRQFRTYMVSHVSHFEDSFYQRQEGMLDDAAFATFVGGVKASVSRPGYRAGWNLLGGKRADEFAKFMEAQFAQTPLARSTDDLAEWKDALAAVNARSAS